MKAFKLKYESGEFETVYGESSLEIVRRYDLATKKHINTRIFELSGEQLALALADYNDSIS